MTQDELDKTLEMIDELRDPLKAAMFAIALNIACKGRELPSHENLLEMARAELAEFGRSKLPNINERG